MTPEPAGKKKSKVATCVSSGRFSNCASQENVAHEPIDLAGDARRVGPGTALALAPHACALATREPRGAAARARAAPEGARKPTLKSNTKKQDTRELPSV